MDQEQTTLGKMRKGQEGVILGYNKSSAAYKQKLLSLGLTPGTSLKVLRVAPLGDPVDIKVCASRVSLRKHEADVISVEICSNKENGPGN